MTVGELKAILKTMDDHIEVFGYVEEGDSGLVFRLHHISESNTVIDRDEQDVPMLSLRKNVFSQPACIIEMSNINEE